MPSNRLLNLGLSIISSSNPLQCAQGQLVEASVTMKSDQMLIGEVLRFNAGLYISSSTNNAEWSWQITMPASGTSDCTYIGGAVNENFRLELEVIDAYTFKLNYHFIALTDLDGYLNDFSYNNSSILNSFSSNKNLAISAYHVIEGDIAEVLVPINVNGFNSELLIDVSGFNPNEDLEVRFMKGTDEISNTWYCGLLKTDNVTGNSFFVDDYHLNYGIVQNGVSPIHDDIPMLAFSSGIGFTYNGLVSQGKITVDKSYLNQSDKYRLYAVYRENGIWKSYLTPELSALSSDREQVLCNVSTQVTDTLGNVYANPCLSGLAPGSVSACVEFDIMSYNSNLAAAGISGGFADYYQGVNVFVSDGEPNEGYLGQSILYRVDQDANKLKVCINYNQEGSGEKYFAFQLKTIIDGVVDYLNVVIHLGFVGVITNVDYSLQNAAGSQVLALCAEGGGGLNSGLADTCEALISVNGSNYQNAGTLGGLQFNGYSEGDIICVKAICEGTPTTDDCVCPECEGQADIYLNQNTCTENTLNLTIAITNSQKEIVSGNVIIRDPLGFTYTEPLNVITNSVHTIPLPGVSIPETLRYFYVIELWDVEGCYYRKNLGNITTPNADVGGCAESINLTVYAQGTTDCDCQGEEPVPNNCENVLWFESECDPSTGQITVTPRESFASPVAEDTISSPLTGVGELTVTRSVSFSDGCDPITATEVFTCATIRSCNNSLVIESDITNGIVTLTETESFDSVIASNTGLKYSLDNGATWEDYTSPVELAEGNTLIYSRSVLFEDGCDDIIQSGSITNEEENEDPSSPECAGYNAFSISASYDTNTQQFSATWSGDESLLEISEMLWLIGGSDPFDNNNSGVPYFFSPINGQGVFVVGWKIKLPDCEEAILYATAYGQPTVVIDEIPPIDINSSPPITIDPTSLPIEFCQVQCDDCGCTFEIVCDACIGSIVNAVGCDGFTFEWYDPDNNLVGIGTSNIPLEIEGNYTIKAISANGACTHTETYYNDKPNAGTPISNPINI